MTKSFVVRSIPPPPPATTCRRLPPPAATRHQLIDCVGDELFRMLRLSKRARAPGGEPRTSNKWITCPRESSTPFTMLIAAAHPSPPPSLLPITAAPPIHIGIGKLYYRSDRKPSMPSFSCSESDQAPAPELVPERAQGRRLFTAKVISSATPSAAGMVSQKKLAAQRRLRKL